MKQTVRKRLDRWWRSLHPGRRSELRLAAQIVVARMVVIVPLYIMAWLAQ